MRLDAGGAVAALRVAVRANADKVRIRFLGDFDWKPRPQVTVGYLAGAALEVPIDVAEAAERAGRAERINA